MGMNTTAKQTPGPWEHWGDGYVRHRNTKNRAGAVLNSMVCTVSLPGANDMRSLAGGYGSYGDAKAIQAANARLIAAAPDLLAACKAIVADGACGCYAARGSLDTTTMPNCAYCIAKRAVAKAEDRE